MQRILFTCKRHAKHRLIYIYCVTCANIDSETTYTYTWQCQAISRLSLAMAIFRDLNFFHLSSVYLNILDETSNFCTCRKTYTTDKTCVVLICIVAFVCHWLQTRFLPRCDACLALKSASLANYRSFDAYFVGESCHSLILGELKGDAHSITAAWLEAFARMLHRLAQNTKDADKKVMHISTVWRLAAGNMHIKKKHTEAVVVHMFNLMHCTVIPA